MAESESLEEYWSDFRPNPRRGGRGKARKLENEVFGLLTVICRVGSQEKTGISLWKCRCRCGRLKIVARDRLVRGAVKSCGCLRRSLLRKGNVQMIQRRSTRYSLIARD